jgi:eukaryotic-like serine/threonine-protein kinase
MNETEKNLTENDSVESDGNEIEFLQLNPNEEAGKVKTGRIPKPAPRNIDTTVTSIDEPLSSETISMKRPMLQKEGVKLVEDKRLKIFCYNCEQKLDLTDMDPFSNIECPSCQSHIIVPRWFDNYLLEEACGEGGMAKVYRGLDLALDREIAIKILNDDIAEEATKGKLFLHEARTAATLNHYALLPIYTCGQFEDQPYIVMQFMAGGSLDKEIDDLERGEFISMRQAVKWLLDAAEGLDNARRHGIVHHDIKPGNFMLDAEGDLKIGDFGISQALHDSRSEEIAELTKLWVSPDYVSPEKITTGKETYLGDIYSLGATFYHVFTGHTPFDYEIVEDLLKAKTVKDPIDIKKFREDIPDGLAKLIMAMMSRTPEARPSYRDIIAEVNSVRKGLGGKKRKSPAAVQKAKNPVMAMQKPGKSKRKRSSFNLKKKKSSILAMIVQFVLFLVLVGGAFYLWNNGYFDQFIGGSSRNSVAADYLPDVSSRLSSGKSQIASMLAETALDSAELEVEGKKQAALQLAIATYLNNDKNAPSKCGIISDRLISTGVERDDPVMSILRYLSAGPINPSNLRDQLTGETELKLVGGVAIFVKEVFNKGSDSEIRTAYRNFDSTSVDDGYWGNVSWKDRITLWHGWLFLGKGNSATLEPLIVSARKPNSSEVRRTAPVKVVKRRPVKQSQSVKARKHDPSLSLSALTPAWLKEHRAFASSRPKPRDYTFLDSAIQAYLSKLPKQYVQSETNRADQFTPLKDHLCGMMLHMPYGNTSIKRRRGRPVVGSLMANRNYISVKLRSGKRVRVMWRDVHFDQFTKFLNHYARLRGEADAGETVDKSKQKREAAWGYLRIAILCDWYGKYKDAVRFTRKAVSVDKGIENDAIIYMME